MRRAISTAALLLVTAVSTTACGSGAKGPHRGDIEFELTVTGTTVQKITYTFAGLAAGGGDRVPETHEVAAPKLPWSYKGFAQPGEVRLELAGAGKVACEIEVDGDHMSGARGAAPLSCGAILKP